MDSNFRHIENGVNLIPKTSSTASEAGSIDFNTSQNKANLHNGTTASPLVTENHTATLTNKTLTAPVISTIVNTGTLTLPTTTDTLVGRVTTDTLENKTIDANDNTISNLTNSNLSGSAGITGANIATNTITNSNLAQMNAHTFKGNNTGSTANASDLTATQLTAELNNFVGDSGLGGTKGLVPAPAAGDAAAAKFLKADGSWANVTGQGVVSIGTIDSQTASTDGAVITGTSLVMQSASSTRPGLVNNTTQTMSGAKTFSTSIATPSIFDNGAGLTIQTSSNQDLTIQTLNAGRMKIRGGEGTDFEQVSTPSNPASGYSTFYFKSDDLPYFKTDGGEEIPFIPAVPSVSSGSGTFTRTNNTPTDVTNLTLTVTNNNVNSVWDISLQADGTTNAAYIGAEGTGASVQANAFVLLLRDNGGGFVEIARYTVFTQSGATPATYVPSSSFRFTDINPPTGTNTYKIQLFETDNGGGGVATIANTKLQVYSQRL